jgi:hypothetical protein
MKSIGRLQSTGLMLCCLAGAVTACSQETVESSEAGRAQSSAFDAPQTTFLGKSGGFR